MTLMFGRRTLNFSLEKKKIHSFSKRRRSIEFSYLMATSSFVSKDEEVNGTFAVLKATTFQQALGHPLSYARVLMQVDELLDLSCRFGFFDLVGLRTVACLSRKNFVRQRNFILPECLSLLFVCFCLFFSNTNFCLQ